MAKKERIDLLLTERGLTPSRSIAQRLVMAGEVRVNGELITKPARQFERDALIEVVHRPKFVSRGGEKLAAALDAFDLQIGRCICADVGASTGGFTDCLLQAGAAKVYAIDVGHGILHWKLRNDSRVVVMERTNARLLERLPEQVQIVTVDASFISLRLLLPVLRGWIATDSSIVALIKPQFEAGRERVGHGGVVRDTAVHKDVLAEIWHAAQESSLTPRGLIRSPLKGPKGNVEFLMWCDVSGEDYNANALIGSLFSD
ncbi:MAG: TlyA family RNA methyltransferase [Anaerolineales bacterium]|nr:TlyA family RNA methyltransferase [Anaerolineales bacterium]